MPKNLFEFFDKYKNGGKDGSAAELFANILQQIAKQMKNGIHHIIYTRATPLFEPYQNGNTNDAITMLESMGFQVIEETKQGGEDNNKTFYITEIIFSKNKVK